MHKLVYEHFYTVESTKRDRSRSILHFAHHSAVAAFCGLALHDVKNREGAREPRLPVIESGLQANSTIRTEAAARALTCLHDTEKGKEQPMV